MERERRRGETERSEIGPRRGSGGEGPIAPSNGAFLHRDQKRRLAQEQLQLHRRGGGEGGAICGSLAAISEVKEAGGGSPLPADFPLLVRATVRLKAVQ